MNQSKLELQYSRKYTFLLESFDPVGGDNSIPLPANTGFYYNDVEVGFTSNYSKDFYFNFRSTIGGFYSGKRVSFNTELTYRIQPKFNSSIKIRYDDIYFPSEVSVKILKGQKTIAGETIIGDFSKNAKPVKEKLNEK